MNERELLTNWADQKLSGNYWRLAESCEVGFEFVGHKGHPSSYANVKFSCRPSDKISLDFAVEWPEEFDSVYTLRIKHSIAEAVLDVLFTYSNLRVYRGCQLRLTEFGWDEVGGSEVAVYRAASQAMQKLRDNAQWVEINFRYREYLDD